jgi:hypothetical protein
MTDPECLELLQQRLDGLSGPQRETLEQHLAVCSRCRELHQAAGLLEEGLHEMFWPQPSPGLAERIIRQVTAEVRARLRWRQRAAALAAAACVLLTPLALSLLSNLGGSETGLEAPLVKRQPQSAAGPSLEESASEAGAAMAALTDRLTGQTREQARLLWQAATPLEALAPVPEPETWQAPLAPAARSFRDAGRGFSASFETVARSARRAFSYFAHEVRGLD